MKYKLTFDHNITRWDEGIPLGNGRMGCLIWGCGKELYFNLDRVDIWDRTTPFGIDNPEFSYKTMVKLAAEKNAAKFREIFDAPYNSPVPTKLPVGKITLVFPREVNVKSELNLNHATASLSAEVALGAAAGQALGAGSGNWKITSFISAAENVGIIQITGEDNTKKDNTGKIERENIDSGLLQLLLEPPEYEGGGELAVLNYTAAKRGEIRKDDNTIIQYFRQDTGQDFSYGVVLGIRETEDSILACYRVVTSQDGGDWLADSCREVGRYLEKKPAVLEREHKKWWKRFWEKSALILPDKEFEKQWYLSCYLLASCSREGGCPMPLQGVWTAADGKLPPWKGDYHNDLNTQMSYYPYLKANHLDEGRVFLDFLWNRREAGRRFAEKFYESPGQCLPAVMTIDGLPLGGWGMYALSPANQIWLCHAFAEYFRYTGDFDFLRERAYPYLEETAECIKALLTEGEDGFLYLPISSSPEIHDDEAEAFVTPNSNYDLALMHFLFETLAKYAEILENGKAVQWDAIRERLPELSVSDSGVFLISPDEKLMESHRHFSHAMAVHPLRQVSYRGEENRRRIDATIADLEALGTENWVGFSFCWMAELYAVQKNGEKAGEMLSIFWNYFCSPNGFHLNGDYKNGGYSHFTYRPFTLEANMCAADALMEMLFYMKDGELEVFPAIPAEWEKKRTAFVNLRGEGGILVSAELVKGRLTEIRIDTDREETYLLTGWSREGVRSRNTSFEIRPGTTVF